MWAIRQFRRRLRQVSGVVCLCLVLQCGGCARTAVVKFWQPAGVDVSDLDRIMVLDFSGDQGKSVSSSLSGELCQSRFFSVVPLDSLQSPFQMASFLSPSAGTKSSTTLESLLGPARAQGIDGVVVGNVIEYRCDDKQVRKTPFRPGQDHVPVEEDGRRSLRDLQESTMREGRVTVQFQLVDVDSGEVRAEHQVSHEFQQLIDKGGQIPSQGEILEQLTQKCLQDIVAYLTPHQVTSQIQMAHGDAFSRGRREIRDGMLLAESGKWDDAQRKWEQVIQKEPDNHAALFNLAVVADHHQDYSLAEDYAMKALRIQYKDLYATGLEQIRAHRTAATRATEQRDFQITRIFADEWK